MDGLIGKDRLDAAEATARSFADLPPLFRVLDGSGWGALEAVRRRAHGMAWIDDSGTPFRSETITAEQQPWLDLLDGRGFAPGAKRDASFVSGADWLAALEAEAPSASTLLHRGVIRHASGGFDEADELYRASLDLEPSAAAHRGRALLLLRHGDATRALEQYCRACALEPDNGALRVEAATAAVRSGSGEAALAFTDPVLNLPSAFGARRGRLLLLRAEALELAGDVAGAANLLRVGIEVADLREGENALAALWRRVIPGEDVPGKYQFGMTDEPA
jgi:tetratricopeptide (TPR) repeat protein